MCVLCIGNVGACRQRQQVNGLSSGTHPSAYTSSDSTRGLTCGAMESHSGRQHRMARSHTR